MNDRATVPNPDLVTDDDNFSRWAQAGRRRHGWHNLHTIARYVTGFRAERVLPLETRACLPIAQLEEVRHYTSLPWFSAMVVVRGQHILFERYAPDFGPGRPHSAQSISKTLLNLIIGSLVDKNSIDLTLPVSHYVPEIGTGYADATVQQVLNMDVANDYSEDFSDPKATYFRHEEAFGWRLPADHSEITEREFLTTITSDDIANRSGYPDYKDANAALLGWVAERAGGRPLRACLADIVDAAGMAGMVHITTDRDGVPTLAGGLCLTARDMARYMALFARRGQGVTGQEVGSRAFIERSLTSGTPMPAGAFGNLRYSNHVLVTERSVAGAGWGGQYATANLETGTVAVFFSVLENRYATVDNYLGPIIETMEHITSMQHPDD